MKKNFYLLGWENITWETINSVEIAADSIVFTIHSFSRRLRPVIRMMQHSERSPVEMWNSF